MDWKWFTGAFQNITTQAKEYGDKVVNFSEKQLKNTPAFLKTVEDFEKISHEKRLILIIAQKDTEDYNKIMARYPIFAAKAWMMIARLHLIDSSLSADLVAHLQLDVSLAMLVYKEWSKNGVYTKLDDITSFFDNPSFTEQKEYSKSSVQDTSSPSPETPKENDPLS